MSLKPSLVKGTRDFGPEEMAKRTFILDSIRNVFKKFGFMPLETPAMERLDTLTGKYGDEGDQLLFRILNSGDFLSSVDRDEFEKGSSAISPKIAQKGLKYDLTVPFARYTVMNQHAITFPFKRYQIQPVWRADNPQRGRYREFYQCDADVLGTNSLSCEAEIILMIQETFRTLGIHDYTIKINHRKLLTAVTHYIGAAGKESEFCVAIDKLDKIGEEKVYQEMNNRGISIESTERLEPFMKMTGDNRQKLATLAGLLRESGSDVITEIEYILGLAERAGATLTNIDLDLTLARGLSYYTGTIFEVKVKNVSIGSVSGGGRYDDLTGIFGLSGMSGVGFSFGVDRLYDVMEELDIFPSATQHFSQLLIIPFDQDSWDYGWNILQDLRSEGISTELYPEPVKPKKMFSYADKKNIPFVLVIGEQERNSGMLTFKNMQSGEQESIPLEQVLDRLKSAH
jgi:histidyl-tRNA synthetase